MSQKYFLGVLDLSKEVLWVSVGERAAKLQVSKLEAWKKFCDSAHHAPQAAVWVRYTDHRIILKVWQTTTL